MVVLLEVKRKRQLPYKIQEHLLLPNTFQIKSIIAVYTFILLNFSIIPLIFPNYFILSSTAIPLIVVVNLWCLVLLLKNVYKIQISVLLFLGVFGVVGTISYYLLFYKYVFLLLGNENVYFLGTSFIALLLFIIYFMVYYSNLHKIKSKSPTNINRGLSATLAPVIGYVLYQFVSNHSNEAVLSLMGVIFYIFTLFFAYTAVKFIHKYMFIKANIHLVKLEKPLKKTLHEKV